MTSWPDLDGRLDGRIHRLPIRIYYADTDFSGVVYHGTYVQFFERGRSDFLRLIGVHHRAMSEGAHGSPVAFAIRRMTLDFRAPARIDDVLEVATRLTGMSGARMTLLQTILLDEAVLVSAEVEAVLISPEGRPRRIPREVAALVGPYVQPAEISGPDPEN